MVSFHDFMVILIPISILVSIFAGIYQLINYRSVVSRWGGLAIFGVSLNLICYFFLFTNLLPAFGKYLLFFEIIGFLLLDIAYLIFVVYFTGHAKWITRYSIAFLFVIPILIIVLMIFEWATFPGGLVERATAFGFNIQTLKLSTVGFEVLFFGFSDLTIFICIFLLVRKLFNSPPHFRKTLLGLIIGSSIATAASLVEQLGGNPLFYASILQFTLTFNAIPIFIVAFNWKALSSIPITQKLFKDTMRDGYVILDSQDQVIDYNFAVKNLLGEPIEIQVGSHWADIFPDLKLPLLQAKGQKQAPFIPVPFKNQKLSYEVMAYPVGNDSSDNLGRMFVFHNVTERDALEDALRQKVEEFSRSNAFLSGLASLTLSLQTAGDPFVVMEALGAELRRFGLTCFVALYPLDSNELVVRYFSANPDTLRLIEKAIGIHIFGYHLDRKHFSSLYQILETRQIHFLPDEESGLKVFLGNLPGWMLDPLVKASAVTRKEPSMLIPLIAAEKLIGGMGVWGMNLQAADISTFQIFGSQVGWAIEKAVLQDTEARRLDELSHSNLMIMALSGVASQLDSTTDLSQVLATLGKELRKVKLSCMVGTIDETQQNMQIEYLTFGEEMKRLSHKLGITWPDDMKIPRRLWPTDKAVTEKVPFWDPNPIGNAYRMFPYIPKEFFYSAMRLVGLDLSKPVCYLPMINEENVIGILAVWGAQLKREDIPALGIFANQVATAIRNTQLYMEAQNEIADRTLAEARIREALTEKEVLIKEVHHRVKNNLQVISSLLNLQAADIKDPNTLDVLKESQNRVRTMALIHEKLYQSSDLARIDFSTYLQSLVYSLSQSYRVKSEQVSVQVDAEKILLDLDTAIPCGLMVNELVSNSIKYAFPEDRAGQIKVSCSQRSDKRYSLIVSDDGIGLPPDLDYARSPSLGLKLVTSLVDQIDGELIVDRKNGTRFEIIFMMAETN